MRCSVILREKGYNLQGYSMDTYYHLDNNDLSDPEECEGLLAFLESQYG